MAKTEKFENGQTMSATVLISKLNVIPSSKEGKNIGKYLLETVPSTHENMAIINESGRFFLTDAQLRQIGGSVGLTSWTPLGRACARFDSKLIVTATFRKAGEAYNDAGDVYTKDHWAIESYDIELGPLGNEIIDKVAITVDVNAEQDSRLKLTEEANAKRRAFLMNT